MKRIAMTIVALMAPFSAQANEYYIGGYGALAFIKSSIDLEFDFGQVLVDDIGDIEYERGEQFGVVIGGRSETSGLRIELDFAYLRADLESAEGNSGFIVELDDDAEAYTVMINVAWDFLKPSFFRPYVMGGIGAAWLDLGTATV